MHYIEKVKLLLEKVKTQTPENIKKYGYIHVDFYGSEWAESELEDILKSYPYVPKSYMDFIKEFDGMSIFFVDFYSSKKQDSLILQEEIDEFYQYLGDDYFPFAKDPAGSIFAIARDGSIVLFDIDDYEFENPEKIAEDFDDFMENYVLGERGWDFEGADELKGYQLLKSLGWI